jgi:hypothetical protein
MTAKKKKPVKKAARPRGRPTKYKPEYCQSIIDYFTIEPLIVNDKPVAPPYIQEFCLSIGISKQCLSKWVAKYPDFSDAYSIAKSKQKQLMITLALQGHYNAGFTWRAMMNMHNWRDKQDHQVEVKPLVVFDET